MRVAILVAVVAAHIVLIWLFPSLRRLVLQAGEDEVSVTPVFLPPLPPELMGEPIPEAETPSSWEAPLLYRSASAQADGAITQQASDVRQQRPRREDERRTPSQSEATPQPQESAVPLDNTGVTGPSSQQSPSAAAEPRPPDWRAQAELTAQTSAQHIVEAEDDAARKAAALTSRFKPLPGPRVPAPAFGWDETPMHRFTPTGNGGFVLPLTDHCAIMVLIVPMIGCSIGQNPPANGDLFKNMHGQVKFSPTPSPH
jgi:hypothetical protein